MRRIVMFNRVSADGYFADSNSSLDWIVADPKLDEYAMSSDLQLDTILFGRRTYDMFAAYWPNVRAVRSSHTDPVHYLMRKWPWPTS